jgi:hypothetical protein
VAWTGGHASLCAGLSVMQGQPSSGNGQRIVPAPPTVVLDDRRKGIVLRCVVSVGWLRPFIAVRIIAVRTELGSMALPDRLRPASTYCSGRGLARRQPVIRDRSGAGVSASQVWQLSA